MSQENIIYSDINNSEFDKELRFQKNNITPSKNDIDNMIESLPIINENIRNNIEISLAIFKKINNFDHYYIHNYNEKL